MLLILKPFKKWSPRLNILLLLFFFGMPECSAAKSFGLRFFQNSDTIHVAAPEGRPEIDRINVQRAFDAVRPGDVIQFASGIYYLGAGARLTVPDVSVLGHPEGTILRGCNFEAFDVEESEVASVVFGCTGIYIQALRQTIRGLTFENMWHALVVGSFPTSQEEASTMRSSDKEQDIYAAGGQLIEKNTFRSLFNGLRMLGTGKELSIVRDNDFIDVFHAIGIYGGPLHFLNNRVTVENPERVPFSRHPGSAILVYPGRSDCSGHVIAENLIKGYSDPIYVNADPGEICQGVKILDNTIYAARVKIPQAWVYQPTEEDSTLVGAPITLMNNNKVIPGKPEADSVGVLKHILVRGNNIVGAEGLGIIVQGVSESIIEDNTITKVKRRSPFPGITWDGIAQEWEEANGSGIWLSPGSYGNEITGNKFEDIAAAAVYVAGDRNRVEIIDKRDSIRDMGSANKIAKIKKAANPTVAFTNVTIIDVEDGVAEPAMTVIVDGERITAVGPVNATKISADATVIDATGKFLIPGLWDMHVHTGSDKFTREVIYPLLIAHGVTGIRNMHADCIECGEGYSIEQVKARSRAIASGDILGPRVVASSSFAGSHEQAAKRQVEGSSPQAPATEEDARAFVRLAKERGADFIKVYNMLTREAYFALVDEANKLQLPFAGHVPIAVRASEASDAGQKSIEHLGMEYFLGECSTREEELRRQFIAALHKAEMGSRTSSDGPALLPLALEMVDTYDSEKCADLADRFIRNGTWIVPTLMVNRLPEELGEGWREDPYVRFLSSEERQLFEDSEEAHVSILGDASQRAPISQKIREMLDLMNRTGVKILAGTDAGSDGVFWGISLHQELELLVDAGLSEAEALRAATLRPAEFFQITDILGTIEVGKKADLVLLDANPLEDISNTQKIEGVVLNGRYFNRQALDEMLIIAEKATTR